VNLLAKFVGEIKTYVNPVHLVETKDGKCPDGFIEVQTLVGGLSPYGIAILSIINADYRRNVIKALEALIPEHDHLDGHEYVINECIKAARSVELIEP
jgi:hypothetical protein